MMPHPQAIVLAAFTAMMLAAAFEDFRRLVIPNALTASLGALWCLYFAAEPSLYGGLAAIGCAAAVFIGGAVMFARGYLGGGDVKLLAAATLWAGPAGTPTLLVLTGMLGGVLALFLLLPFGGRIVAFARRGSGETAAPAKRRLAMPVPYGVAIAGAALIVTLTPHLG